MKELLHRMGFRKVELIREDCEVYEHLVDDVDNGNFALVVHCDRDPRGQNRWERKCTTMIIFSRVTCQRVRRFGEIGFAPVSRDCAMEATLTPLRGLALYKGYRPVTLGNTKGILQCK